MKSGSHEGQCVSSFLNQIDRVPGTPDLLLLPLSTPWFPKAHNGIGSHTARSVHNVLYEQNFKEVQATNSYQGKAGKRRIESCD